LHLIVEEEEFNRTPDPESGGTDEDIISAMLFGRVGDMYSAFWLTVASDVEFGASKGQLFLLKYSTHICQLFVAGGSGALRAV
jgi:hypothetical protein